MRKLGLIILAVMITFTAVACGADEKDANRREDVQQRETVFQRAENEAPIVEPQNFPLRKTLVKFVERQDEINHPWYIYLYSMTGEPIGYYVGQTYPISSCNFLSSSENLVDVPDDGDSAPDFIVSAPSLDGMYYGGAGGSAACDSMFFFDATTDAMITFAAPYWTATDQASTSFNGPALGATSAEDIADGAEVVTPEPVTTTPPPATEAPE